MRYLLLFLFAILHLIAAVFGKDINMKSRLLMLVGSLIILYVCTLGLSSQKTLYMPLIIGGILIIDSALYNGYKNNDIHFSHHIIRFVFFAISFSVLFIQ